MSDIEARLSAVEERLGMQEGLRASQDRDVSDMRDSLRAQTHLIQALAITQGQHTQSLERVFERLDDVDAASLRIIGMLRELLDRGQGE
jgi:hypothetical protein